MRAEKKSAKTIRTYLEAAQWFAAEYLVPAGFTDWDAVRAKQAQEWTVTLLGRYSDAYANSQFRALQQSFKWHATEDPDEQRPTGIMVTASPRSLTARQNRVRWAMARRCWAGSRVAGLGVAG